MKVAYFVHDLNDPAVPRRVRLLRAGGAEVALLGFHRGPAPAQVEGITPRSIGRTADARLASRAISVSRALLAVPRWRAALAGADVVLARQLETLVLAALARSLHARSASLVFECLDVHRLMTSPALPGRILRALEGALLRHCAALVVSSPEFVRAHFAPAHRTLPPVALVENKVMADELPDAAAPAIVRAAPRPDVPPWRIGWFGMIRCRRSLDLLASLVRALPGQVEVVIRGRVAIAALPEFDRIVAATPGLTFHGSYDRARDLAAIYGDVHFTWTMDFYEAGANSDWLLPNRLYEGGLFGTVPIALRNVAVGNWLERHGAGVLLEEDLATALVGWFSALTVPHYLALRAGMAAIPEAAFVYGAADCRRIVAELGRAPPPRVPAMQAA